MSPAQTWSAGSDDGWRRLLRLSLQAGAGFVRIGDATTRRHLQGAAHSPNAARPLLRNKLAAPGNASKASVAGRALRPQRALLQSTCTEEAARQVLGDINFDCIFDLAGDVLTMDLVGICALVDVSPLQKGLTPPC